MPSQSEIAQVDALVAAWHAEAKPAADGPPATPKPMYLSKLQLARSASAAVLASRPDLRAALAEIAEDEPAAGVSPASSGAVGWDREGDPLVLAARRQRDAEKTQTITTTPKP